jgi:hypothetical protein
VGAVAEDALTVKTEMTVAPEVNVTPVGFRLQLRPEDGAFVDKVNAPLKPYWLVIEIDDVADDPGWMVRELWLADMLKSGATTWTATIVG